jgi:serine/threonine-protein kinase RsbW
MSVEAGVPGGEDPRAQLHRLLEEDPADLYEHAPCGYLSTLPDGSIVKVNATFCAWTGRTAEDLLGARLQDLLAPGGRIFTETHLVPLLRLQGAVREIALDVVRVDGSLLPCLLNAVEVRDDDGLPVMIRATLFDATARRRYERELLAAQRAAAESEARARTLHRLVSDLSAATSVQDVAAVVVARSMEAVGAAGAALVLLDPTARPSGDLPGMAVARAEGMPAELLRAVRRAAGDRLSLELAQGVRGVPLDDRLREQQPELAAALAGAGFAELVVVPLPAETQRLGVLLLGVPPVADGALISLEEPGARRPLQGADIGLLDTLGRQTGQALERARLHEETARQTTRAGFLLDAARLLAAAQDVHETAQRMVELAVPRLADLCVIDLATEEGLRREASRYRDPARQHLADELRSVQRTHRVEPLPSIRALKENRTQWIRHLDDDLLRAIAADDRFVGVVRELGLESVISVPLQADGQLLGVLTLCADRQRGPFSEADVEVAEQLALQVALVVDKALRYELDVSTSHTLQASLLPPSPPDVPGLASAVRYLPATRGVEIGGDFYDVVRLPGDAVALAVGDVVGHDVTAAATMGQLTSVHRALLVDGPAPADIVDRLQASWSLLGLQRMATALFATLHPATGRLRIASAGHPPPLVLDGGRARYLQVPVSRMLGAPAPAPAAEWAGELAPGATLVLFTDGLVERRGATLDTGLERLRTAVERAGTSRPDELCDSLLAGLAGVHRADDIALLVLTRAG